MQSHVVGTGIPFAEGPVWCPDGTVIVTSVAEGALYRVWPEQEKTDCVARTRGGANGAALAADGSILVTQNGGIDYSKLPVPIPEMPPFDPAAPGLQLAAPDGDVTYLASDGLHGPNDVAVASDGRVFFTDPGHYPPPDDELVGRVM